LTTAAEKATKQVQLYPKDVDETPSVGYSQQKKPLNEATEDIMLNLIAYNLIRIPKLAAA
jgi:hypothetical protein